MRSNMKLVVALSGCIVFLVALVAVAAEPVSTPSGLKIEFLQKGNGAKPEKGQTVEVHYTGTLEDGKEFDCSRDRNETLKIKMGTDKVLPGFDEGLTHMKVGDRVKLTIPPQLGYGAKGMEGAIPPNAMLFFDVEMLSVK